VVLSVNSLESASVMAMSMSRHSSKLISLMFIVANRVVAKSFFKRFEKFKQKTLKRRNTKSRAVVKLNVFRSSKTIVFLLLGSVHIGLLADRIICWMGFTGFETAIPVFHIFLPNFPVWGIFHKYSQEGFLEIVFLQII
jgi:hypothetical protein